MTWLQVALSASEKPGSPPHSIIKWCGTETDTKTKLKTSGVYIELLMMIQECGLLLGSMLRGARSLVEGRGAIATAMFPDTLRQTRDFRPLSKGVTQHDGDWTWTLSQKLSRPMRVQARNHTNKNVTVAKILARMAANQQA